MNPLDLITATLGLAYILLEYRASIWMWAVGFVMQALGIVLYYQKGLYADCAMEFYYISMTVYGFWKWRASPNSLTPNPSPTGEGSDYFTLSEHKDRTLLDSTLLENDTTPLSPRRGAGGEASITHIPYRVALRWTLIALTLWLVIYLLLVTLTDSRVPIADSFTTALSLVGIWALAHKYIEQWFVWIAVDIVTSALYFYKDIPFKASLYALYVIIAIFGYRKWKKMMNHS